MFKAKVYNIYRQVFFLVSLILFSSLTLSYWFNPNWIWLTGFIATMMFLVSLVGYCPMLFFLKLLPWNKNNQ